MKKILFYIVAMTISVAGLKSCKFKEDVNTDPVNPSDAPMSAILPVAQVGIGYTVGGNIARFNGMFMQHISGVDRQALTIGQYNIGQQDTDDPWDNMYRFMKNLQVIIDKAKASKSPHYQGISEILMAYSLGVTTDLWGDVPYSEALKGTSDGTGLRPKFDSQQGLYDTIQNLLDRGIANCKIKESVFTPTSDDVIYNGVMKNWIAFGYAIKARHFLHTCKLFPANYSKVLENLELAQFSVDAKVPFPGTSATSQSPMFQFNDQRGDIVVASAYMDYIKSTTDTNQAISGDPRIFNFTDFAEESLYSNDSLVVIDTTKVNDSLIFDTSKVAKPKEFLPIGSFPGDGNFDASYVGSYIADAGAPVYLMTQAEIDFMKAEANFMLGNKNNALTSFKDGIKSSLKAVTGSSDYPDFMQRFDTISPGNLTLKAIIEQKWAAGFMNPETWNDWRRTGFPELSPAIGNTTQDRLPRRYPYPQKERTLNAANVPDEGVKPVLKPVWWDSK